VCYYQKVNTILKNPCIREENTGFTLCLVNNQKENVKRKGEAHEKKILGDSNGLNLGSE